MGEQTGNVTCGRFRLPQFLPVFMDAGCRDATGGTLNETARKFILESRCVLSASATILLSALVSLKNELPVITVSEAQVKSSVSRTLGFASLSGLAIIAPA